MKSEPPFFYLLRLALLSLILFFLLMLWWSNQVIEENLISIKSELNSLKSRPHFTPDNSNPKEPSKTSRADPAYPNLLEVDPFYTKTLPDLLLPKDFEPSGTLHSASYGRPDSLHPFSNWAEIFSWMSLCTPSVAKNRIGIWETLSPDMALKMEERPREGGGTEFWVHLRDQVFWQPLKQEWFTTTLAPWFLEPHPVTAEDFKFAYDAVMNPFMQEAGAIAARIYLAEIEAFEVIDDRTFVVRWKRHEIGGELKNIYQAKLITGSLSPLASFVYKYFPDGKKIIDDKGDLESYRKNSVFASNFTEHWAKNIIPSSGPYTFNGMTEEKIDFVRNPDHFSPLDALVERREVSFKNSSDAIWKDFRMGALATYTLPPDQLLDWQDFQKSPLYESQKSKVKTLEYLGRAFVYIGWNQANPLFSSKKVRQALTMAIDRKRIIEQNLNGRGVEITGPFWVGSPSNDTSIKPLPFDPVRARQLLADEGWQDSDGDGILDKTINGTKTPFRFTLTYYVKNSATKTIVDTVVVSLKKIGIECEPKGVDMADLSSAIDGKTFEALLMGWQLGSPPEDPKQLWSSTGAKERGSSNIVGFSNPQADKIIEQLQFESNRDKRLALYHSLQKIIYDEQPYTFLYTPKQMLLYRDFLENVFLPADRQDLIPGANIQEPNANIFWIKG